MSALADQVARIRATLDAVEARGVELERQVQDLDAEMAACDVADECARIAFRRQGYAFELADLVNLLRGTEGGLALAARHEREPVLRRAA